jgi:predicted nucleotidyltransferase
MSGIRRPVILVPRVIAMNQLVEQKREQIAAICREYHVRRLALFGSALRDDFDPSRSDLDFVVEFEPLASGTYASTYFGLIEALERLFDQRVDLVEAGSVRNPYFRQEIELHQEPLYAA